MSGVADHRRQRAENLAFLGQIRANNPRDFRWETTTMYYAAVHGVDMVLASQRQPFDPEDHEQRKRALRNSYLRGNIGTYIALENLSRHARYDAHIPFTEAHLEAAEQVSAALDRALRGVFRDIPC